MYFEPAKRTYYRFPSANSINDLDSRYYFPKNPHAIEEDTRYYAKASGDMTDKDDFTEA